MQSHTSLIRHRKEKDGTLLVSIAVNAGSSSMLTVLGFHDVLDNKVAALPNVIRCKQHGWINEDDDAVLYEVWVRVTGTPKAAAQVVRADIENIFRNLSPHVQLSEARKVFTQLMSSAKGTVRSLTHEKWRHKNSCPTLEAWLAGDFQKVPRLAKKDKKLANLRMECRQAVAYEQIHVVETGPATMLSYKEAAALYPLRNEMQAAYVIPREGIVAANLHQPGGSHNDFWIFNDTKVFQWRRDEQGFITAAYLYDSSKGGTYPTFVDNYIRFWEQLTWINRRPRPLVEGALQIVS